MPRHHGSVLRAGKARSAGSMACTSLLAGVVNVIVTVDWYALCCISIQSATTALPQEPASCLHAAAVEHSPQLWLPHPRRLPQCPQPQLPCSVTEYISMLHAGTLSGYRTTLQGKDVLRITTVCECTSLHLSTGVDLQVSTGSCTPGRARPGLNGLTRLMLPSTSTQHCSPERVLQGGLLGLHLFLCRVEVLGPPALPRGHHAGTYVTFGNHLLSCKSSLLEMVPAILKIIVRQRLCRWRESPGCFRRRSENNASSASVKV